MKNFRVKFRIKGGHCHFTCDWTNPGLAERVRDYRLYQKTKGFYEFTVGSSCFPELRKDSHSLKMFLRGSNKERDEKETIIRETDFNDLFGGLLRAMVMFDDEFESEYEDSPSIIDYHGEIYEIKRETIPSLMQLFGGWDKKK